MEEREDGHHAGRRRNRQPHGHGDEKAERDDRSKDRRLDEGQGDAGQRKPEAERHHADEGRRHGEDGPPAALGGPEADGDHHENMVEPGQGMQRAMGSVAQRGAMRHGIDMGKGRRGGQHQRGKREAGESGGQVSCHGGVPWRRAQREEGPRPCDHAAILSAHPPLSIRQMTRIGGSPVR